MPVTVKFPIGRVVLLPDEKVHRGQGSLFVGARDTEGRTSPVQRMPASIRIPNDQILVAMGQVASYQVSLVMRPGEHTVVVGLRDELANEESTVRLPHRPDA